MGKGLGGGEGGSPWKLPRQWRKRRWWWQWWWWWLTKNNGQRKMVDLTNALEMEGGTIRLTKPLYLYNNRDARTHLKDA